MGAERDDGSISPTSTASAGEQVIEALLEGDHHLGPDQIASTVRRLCRAISIEEATAYLVDHSQRTLFTLPGTEGEATELDVDGTIAGRAFQTEAPAFGVQGEGSVAVWVPIKDGSERLGVLWAVAPDDDPITLRRLQAVATLIAAMVVSRAQYGDALLLARRRKLMSLAAEMRWSMLPPLTYVGPGITIAGALEPAYEIAGDTFDYGINGALSHVAILDAMGHGLEASLMASLAVSSYRHSRRAGLPLDDTIRAMDAAVSSQFPSDRFVTAQLATLDVASGELRYVSAGHPAPMLVRNGRVIGDLRTAPAPPAGLGLQAPEIMTTGLEPGDRLLLLSDGAIEARSADGALFGRDRLGDLLERAVASGLPASEVMRRLMHALLDHQQDVLQDDATLLLVEWPNGVGSH
ncbi:MAG: SpoIIE family protein phosphatase [Acidimicrobiales bacterium]